jgi:chromate reductase
MQFLLLAGSFHAKSYTQALIRAMIGELQEHQSTVWPIQNLPFYSHDISGSNKPQIVLDFLDAVTKSDAIILCTPEYNHSIPAVLKNAIDWASRPAFKSPLKDKPVTIVTQAGHAVGGARAQAHLKLIMDSTLSRIHICHEMMVQDVAKKFDAEFNLTDEVTKRQLKRHLDDFISFITSVKP